ncbi:insulin-like growth factor-binding protein complex acid labile subunit [Conger conger]|uniref:insulin-like growth factor-binding protein complex acid labile subunit n=1 Tax=Conger conger TaxID=82655 RepID=UPI002A59BFC7|nr:insulin-like growth factor-binding protein complex acid labile subunit [Conger conger]
MAAGFFCWFFFCTFATNAQAQVWQSCGPSCDCITDIKFLNCSHRGFSNVPGDFPPDTEHLDLSGNLLTGLHKGGFRLLWNLRVLLLSDNNITSISDGAFSPLGSLWKLDLSQNWISTLSEGFSLGLGSLRELLLGHNQLAFLEEESFLHLDSLRKLDLSANAIRSVRARTFVYMTALRQLDLRDNWLGRLANGVFSSLRSLEVLNLSRNRIHSVEAGVLTPLVSLALLDLSQNGLCTIRFKTFLSIRTYGTHLLLRRNPWHCDCDLQRVFRKLRSVRRLSLDDYGDLSCAEPAELRGHPLSRVDAELCFAETVTVLVITGTVVIVVLAAIVMAETSKRKPVAKQGSGENGGLEEYAEN